MIICQLYFNFKIYSFKANFAQLVSLSFKHYNSSNISLSLFEILNFLDLYENNKRKNCEEILQIIYFYFFKVN